jgi:putative Mg2+ transporter-C (MgtC) family protein
MILICLGSFLFSTFSLYITAGTSDRIASNIVTGIGFLGAGVIYKSGSRINGLTTAACIWATAALGMGIADGLYLVVGLGTAIVLAALFLFTRLEKWIDVVNQSRNYRIVSHYKPELLQSYENIIRDHNLRSKRVKQTKLGQKIIGTWMVQGREKNHKAFIETILHDPSVEEFEF